MTHCRLGLLFCSSNTNKDTGKNRKQNFFIEVWKNLQLFDSRGKMSFQSNKQLIEKHSLCKKFVSVFNTSWLKSVSFINFCLYKLFGFFFSQTKCNLHLWGGGSEVQWSHQNGKMLRSGKSIEWVQGERLFAVRGGQYCCGHGKPWHKLEWLPRALWSWASSAAVPGRQDHPRGETWGLAVSSAKHQWNICVCDAKTRPKHLRGSGSLQEPSPGCGRVG